MRRVKRPPLWLRRLDAVKAELDVTRFPKTAEEGVRQCAELSAVALRLFRQQAGGDRAAQRLLARLSADEAQRIPTWRRDCARFFGR